MPIRIDGRGMGWLPDYPDARDYTSEHGEIRPLLDKINVANPAIKGSANPFDLPKTVDLREGYAKIDVEDQGSIGSCTAQAGVGLVEYCEARAHGRYINASRLFLYKVTRNLLQWEGDTGAFPRTTMCAMRLFGVPPEQYWLYDITNFDDEPPAFCYAFAANYQAIKYYRLDPPGTPRQELLDRIKTKLAAGFPSMFGFTVFASISQASTTGKIPFPQASENILGGHAVDAVGYDDQMKITNLAPNSKKTVGALLIRNSWGSGWGDEGYGWIPYEYILQWQAIDWWTLISNEWVDTGQFGL